MNRINYSWTRGMPNRMKKFAKLKKITFVEDVYLFFDETINWITFSQYIFIFNKNQEHGIADKCALL